MATKTEKAEIEIRNTLLPNTMPEKHVIPNAKLANSIMEVTKEELTESRDLEATVMTEKKKNKEIKETKIFYAMAYESENVRITGKQPLTEYDRTVADAVTSLYLYGDESHIITPAMVYREMTHITDSESPSPKQLKAVERSIDKMRFIHVMADCSKELKERNKDLKGIQVIGGEIDAYLLPLTKTRIRIKVDKNTRKQLSNKILEQMEIDEKSDEADENVVTAYKILCPPVLYEYSNMTDQVLTVPVELLSICDSNGKRIRSTERRIAIKSYMLRRIEIMKGKTGRHQSHNILYDTIFKECVKCEWDNDPSKEGEAPDGWEDLSRKEQRHIQEYIMQVLDYWKKCKYIVGYKDLYHGKKKRGIEIIFNRKID